jgi:small ligand-binding sensory domain FIST
MFRIAHGLGTNWGTAVKACQAGLGAHSSGHSVGVVYVTPDLANDLGSVLTFLRETTRVPNWVGGVGFGVLGDGVEYRKGAAVAAMTMAIPNEDFRIFISNGRDVPGLKKALIAWLAGRSPAFGLVQADPANDQLAPAINALSAATDSFLVGGIVYGEGREGVQAPRQIANRPVSGSLSGILLSAEVPVVVGTCQSCLPIGPYHVIDECQGTDVIRLDDRRATDVLTKEAGELPQGAMGAMVAFPVEGSDRNDYVVRHLGGVDVVRGWVRIGVEPLLGDRMMFVRRDSKRARQDLERMLADVVRRLEGRKAKAIHYVSCFSRGAELFGKEGEETSIIRKALGGAPLIGFLAGGEICRNRLHTHAGVLTVFV